MSYPKSLRGLAVLACLWIACKSAENTEPATAASKLPDFDVSLVNGLDATFHESRMNADGTTYKFSVEEKGYEGLEGQTMGSLSYKNNLYDKGGVVIHIGWDDSRGRLTWDPQKEELIKMYPVGSTLHFATSERLADEVVLEDRHNKLYQVPLQLRDDDTYDLTLSHLGDFCVVHRSAVTWGSDAFVPQSDGNYCFRVLPEHLIFLEWHILLIEKAFKFDPPYSVDCIRKEVLAQLEKQRQDERQKEAVPSNDDQEAEPAEPIVIGFHVSYENTPGVAIAAPAWDKILFVVQHIVQKLTPYLSPTDLLVTLPASLSQTLHHYDRGTVSERVAIVIDHAQRQYEQLQCAYELQYSSREAPTFGGRIVLDVGDKDEINATAPVFDVPTKPLFFADYVIFIGASEREDDEDEGEDAHADAKIPQDIDISVLGIHDGEREPVCIHQDLSLTHAGYDALQCAATEIANCMLANMKERKPDSADSSEAQESGSHSEEKSDISQSEEQSGSNSEEKEKSGSHSEEEDAEHDEHAEEDEESGESVVGEGEAEPEQKALVEFELALQDGDCCFIQMSDRGRYHQMFRPNNKEESSFEGQQVILVNAGEVTLVSSPEVRDAQHRDSIHKIRDVVFYVDLVDNFRMFEQHDLSTHTKVHLFHHLMYSAGEDAFAPPGLWFLCASWTEDEHADGLRKSKCTEDLFFNAGFLLYADQKQKLLELDEQPNEEVVSVDPSGMLKLESLHLQDMLHHILNFQHSLSEMTKEEQVVHDSLVAHRLAGDELLGLVAKIKAIYNSQIMTREKKKVDIGHLQEMIKTMKAFLAKETKRAADHEAHLDEFKDHELRQPLERLKVIGKRFIEAKQQALHLRYSLDEHNQVMQSLEHELNAVNAQH